MPSPDMRPFVTLLQKHLAEFSRYAMSPEVVGRTPWSAPARLRPGQAAAAWPGGSEASVRLLQGLLRNYTEFMIDLGRRSDRTLRQAQDRLCEAVPRSRLTQSRADRSQANRSQALSRDGLAMAAPPATGRVY